MQPANTNYGNVSIYKHCMATKECCMPSQHLQSSCDINLTVMNCIPNTVVVEVEIEVVVVVVVVVSISTSTFIMGNNITFNLPHIVTTE